MEIVLKYAEETRHKIQYTELRDYAREFNSEFTEIEDRHFSRNKEISEKINDINSRRRVKLKVEENVILYSSGVDRFFELSQMQQREEIQKTRAYFLKLERQIEELQIKNNDLLRAVEAVNKLETVIEELSDQVSKVVKEINIRSKFISATVDDITMERILAEGKNYKNDSIKLKTEGNFLISAADTIFNLQDQIKKLLKLINQDSVTEIKSDEVIVEEQTGDMNDIDSLFPDL